MATYRYGVVRSRIAASQLVAGAGKRFESARRSSLFFAYVSGFVTLSLDQWVSGDGILISFRRGDLQKAGQLCEMKASLFFLNVPFIPVSHTYGAMITNGTHDFHLVSALCGQRLRSLGVGTSFPFPHLSPINAHPPGSVRKQPQQERLSLGARTL